jgi:Transposase DDE domain
MRVSSTRNCWVLRAAEAALYRGGALHQVRQRRGNSDRGLAGLGRGLCGGRALNQVDGLEPAAPIRGGAGTDSRFQTAGGKETDLPEYTFRVLVISLSASAEEIWRDYNQRADMENRIAELKHDLGADRFCLKDFHATDAVF